MASAKIAITLDKNLLRRLDLLIAAKGYPSRSRIIQEAVEEKIGRLERRRLAREVVKLDPAEEEALAEEGMGLDFQEWPEY
jgi:metal-responsive CopG/Arc/MetJ family transcriptional regulator